MQATAAAAAATIGSHLSDPIRSDLSAADKALFVSRKALDFAVFCGTQTQNNVEFDKQNSAGFLARLFSLSLWLNSMPSSLYQKFGFGCIGNFLPVSLLQLPRGDCSIQSQSE